MDWFTVIVLAPFALALLMMCVGLLDGSRRLYTAGWLVMMLYAYVLYDATDVRCRWEGFADGPLPIECRAVAS